MHALSCHAFAAYRFVRSLLPSMLPNLFSIWPCLHVHGVDDVEEIFDHGHPPQGQLLVHPYAILKQKQNKQHELVKKKKSAFNPQWTHKVASTKTFSHTEPGHGSNFLNHCTARDTHQGSRPKQFALWDERDRKIDIFPVLGQNGLILKVAPNSFQPQGQTLPFGPQAFSSLTYSQTYKQRQQNIW